MSHAIDVTDFQTQVLDKSKTTPVVVDFWAPWCQPCRMLGPILEELAVESEGKFILAKVNTDENQQLSQTWGIKGIPAVKIFVNGEVTGEFTGALPKASVFKWLDEKLPDPNKDELKAIVSHINISEPQKSIERLEKLIRRAPWLNDAKPALARLIVFDDPRRASDLVNGIHEDSPHFQLAESIRTLHDFLILSEFEEANIKTNVQNAQAAVFGRDFDKALEELIFALQINKSYMNQLARRICVAIFTLLGNEHQVSKEFRRKFDMSLY